MTQCSACIQHQRGGHLIGDHRGPVITAGEAAAVAGEQVNEQEPGDLGRQEKARPALRKRKYTGQEWQKGRTSGGSARSPGRLV
jgi:hypothetical protein